MAIAAGSTIGALRVVIGADTAGLQRGLKETQSGLDGVGRAASAAAKRVAVLGAAFTAASAAWVNSVSKTMDQAGKMADQIGTTTEALTGLRYAAEQMANVSEGTFDMSLRRMTRRISEAAAGGGAAKNALEELGVSAQELANLPVEEQFLRIADAIEKSDDQGQRLRSTMALFDTEGMPLVNALSQGRDEIIKYVEEAERFGIVISTNAAKAASDFQTNLSQLNAMMSGVGITIANEVLPRLNEFINQAIEASSEVDGIRESAEDLRDSSALGDFADGAIILLGYLADSAIFVAKTISAIGGSFRAVIADAEVAMSVLNKAQVWNWFSDDATQNIKDTYAKRNETVKQANQQLIDLMTYDGARFANAAKETVAKLAFNRNFVGPMPQGPIVQLPTIDATVDGSGGGGGGSGGGAIDKENDQLQQRLENLRQFLATREELEVQAATDRIELIERSLAAGLISEQEHNQMLFDLSGKFYDSMAKLRDEKYQEQRDKLQELNDLEIISDAEYHAQKMDLLAQQEQEKTEALIEAYLQRKEILDEMIAEGDISDEEHKLRMEELEQAHQDELTRIVAQGAQARNKADADEAKNRAAVMSGMMGNLVQLMNSGNKEMFRIGKIAAIAQATLKGGQAVVDAYQAGMSVGGPYAPVVAAAYAATAAATTAAQIASIRSTTFGGGGSSSSGGGGGGSYSRPTDAISNDPLPSEAQRENTSVTINLQGESYSRQQVRDLIEQINEATADGAVLRLA